MKTYIEFWNQKDPQNTHINNSDPSLGFIYKEVPKEESD